VQLLDKAERLGSPTRDEHTFNRWNTLSPDETQVPAGLAYWRARAYLLEGKGDLALPLAQKALDSRKTSDRYFVLGQAYEAAGRKQEAVDAYLAALALSSTQRARERDRLEKLWLSGGFGTSDQLEQRFKARADEAFRNEHYVPKLVDEPVKDYEFVTLKGEKFRSSDLRDKTVILDFWATWCSPCIPELRELQDLQNKHPDVIVAALAISSERKDIDHVIIDEKLKSLRIAQSDSLKEVFANQGVPVTYVIDHGRTRIIHRGGLSSVASYLEADLASLKLANR